MSKEKIYIQIDNDKIELKGDELNNFLHDRKLMLEEQIKYNNKLQAQKELKISAYKKLGLTDEEIAAIL